MNKQSEVSKHSDQELELMEVKSECESLIKENDELKDALVQSVTLGKVFMFYLTETAKDMKMSPQDLNAVHLTYLKAAEPQRLLVEKQ